MQKMSSCIVTTTVTFFLFLLLLATTGCTPELKAVEEARAAVLQARNWARGSNIAPNDLNYIRDNYKYNHVEALSECARLYETSESRLASLLVAGDNYTVDDARTWLSGALANHRTCLDGLEETGFHKSHTGAQNLSALLGKALSLYAKRRDLRRPTGVPRKPRSNAIGGILNSWNPANSKAHFIVALDGSGTQRTINQALAALTRMGQNRPQRVIIYVKSGIYREHVEIEHHMKNLMFVGDGMGRTIVTGSKNVPDGATTAGSATFGVWGDGFWARDMTFENTAGPHKHQAVALRVASDFSVFYRCSFKAYQDTLFTLSLRQFYRDCHIYGTIDFIFGDASAVFQNCDIFVRRPMDHQANMITAQGRDHPDSNTGISIIASRIRAAPDFVAVKNLFKSYLGRPWKKYSRTVVLKTDLDGIIHPKGWTEWRGNFALSTLYYAEYLNSGAGASTANRVKWTGYHVLDKAEEAGPFTVSRFIHGDSWIPETGVPFSLGI